MTPPYALAKAESRDKVVRLARMLSGRKSAWTVEKISRMRNGKSARTSRPDRGLLPDVERPGRVWESPETYFTSDLATVSKTHQVVQKRSCETRTVTEMEFSERLHVFQELHAFMDKVREFFAG